MIKKYILEGIFTEFDRFNRNSVYTLEQYLPHLNHYKEKIKKDKRELRRKKLERVLNVHNN